MFVLPTSSWLSLTKIQSGFVSLLTVILAISLIIVAVGAFWYFQSQPVVKDQLPNSLQLPTPKPTPTPGLVQTYTNKDLGFSFNYPNDWQLTDFKIATGSAATKTAHIVLQLKPSDYTNPLMPIKLIYWDNPNQLALSDLDKRISTASANASPVPIVYSGTDDYVLTGSGLTANLRNAGICENKNCQIYTFSDVDKVYQLESFLDANIYNQKDVLDQILNSFKFSDFKQNVEGISTIEGGKQKLTPAKPH